ncbi:MAG: maleylpyruvate isomerase N-terminal domain-containing protein [Chitinophagaceae bacterium]
MKPPIETLHLFPLVNEKLISFLKQLEPGDWQKQTVAKKWVVKDVAAHLLDGNYRRIALNRDGWSAAPDTAIDSYDDLVSYLNRINADWVKAAKRLSPAILIELLESTNEIVYKEFSKLDPFAIASYPVSWSGETKSYNWFDIAREYTERWLHQQQIRDAVSNNGLMNGELYQPFLHIFMQAWPYTMRDVTAEDDTVLKTVVPGIGEWYLKSQNGEWKLENKREEKITAETIIDSDFAWKLFSKSIRKEEAKEGIIINGGQFLGEKVLDMVSVMA